MIKIKIEKIGIRLRRLEIIVSSSTKGALIFRLFCALRVQKNSASLYLSLA